MVDAIGSNTPPSVQAVNKARSDVRAQREERSVSAPSDSVSISAEAQEISDADRLASETRDLLSANPNQTLGRGESLDELL